MEFYFDVFKQTLTGGAKMLACRCSFVSAGNGILVLSAPASQRALIEAFGEPLRNQIGIDELKLQIELRG